MAQPRQPRTPPARPHRLCPISAAAILLFGSLTLLGCDPGKGLGAESPDTTPPPAAVLETLPRLAVGAARLQPSTLDRFALRQSEDGTELQHLGAPLRRLAGAAFGVHPKDIVFEGVDPAARFDVLLHLAPGQLARERLRTLLQRELGLEAIRRTHLSRVVVLRRAAAAIPLPSSEHEATSLRSGPGRLKARAAPISALADFLRDYTASPVVDETGLAGRYDFVLEWDPAAGGYALEQAFGDLGLTLADDEREVSFLVLRRRTGSDS